MRKIISLLLSLTMIIGIYAYYDVCVSAETSISPKVKQTIPNELLDKLDNQKLTVEEWKANEIALISDKLNTDPFSSVTVDAIFIHGETGEILTVPAFWNGGYEWIIRFALTKTGTWYYYTKCSDKNDSGLHYKAGTIICNAYSGDLEIYKRGFVKTQDDKRYFMYDDGTPFFYLGDTHWTLPMEEIDGIGGIDVSTANLYGIESQFKSIMDYRWEQGFTVIQSQQLARYNGVTGNSWFGDANGTIFTYGLNRAMLNKFKTLDRYFAYIAEKGFVHCHTQFSYPEELIDDYLQGKINNKKLEMLCRYWVARYSAYPVMWATAQECDNDYLGYGGCTPENNPWTLVMRYISKYDPYNHPSTAHQEYITHTRANNSTFGYMSEHDFYAAQYTVDIDNERDLLWSVLREYWGEIKPIVNYEGFYDNHRGSTSRARIQGWTSYLTGLAGHGYGSQPIWSIFWAENDGGGRKYDVYEYYNKGRNWVEGLYSEGSKQLSYMKDFLSNYEWWKLVPTYALRHTGYYSAESTNYAVSTIDNELYIGYFYGREQSTDRLGIFEQMRNAKYNISWFNPRTGKIEKTETVVIANNQYAIPAKPDENDWVIIAEIYKCTEHTPGAAATCTKSQICTVCGEVLAAPKGHKEKTSITKATIKKNGSIVKKCTVCGKVSSKTSVYYPKTIKLSTTEYEYNGKTKKPSVKIYDSKGKKLTYGEDYTYKRPTSSKKVGKYSIKVTFKGDYSGTKTLYYKINPRETKIKSISAGSKKLTVKWSKKLTQSTGYEIQYSTSSTFKSKYTKTIKIKKDTTTSKTIKNLKAKKKYYVRVRCYYGTKTKYYSDWSSKKSVKTK